MKNGTHTFDGVRGLTLIYPDNRGEGWFVSVSFVRHGGGYWIARETPRHGQSVLLFCGQGR